MALKFVVLLVLCFCLISVADAQSKKKKKPKRRVGAIVKDMEQNMTELWREVKTLSQPVHVHIHGGGHVMGQHDHDEHDHFAHCHGEDHDHHEGHDHESHGHEGHGNDSHGHEGHDHEGHGNESHGHEGHGHKGHGHEGHDHEGHGHEGQGIEGHSHESHDQEGHDHEGHDKKGHKHTHADHHPKDKTGKKMKGKKGRHDNKKMRGHMGHEGHEGHGGHKGHMDHEGHEDHEGHGHMHEDHDEFHHDEDGTHVHIHLHTAFEQMMETMKYNSFRDVPPMVPMTSPVPKEYRYARCDVVGNSALPIRERQNIRGFIFFRQMPGEALHAKVNLQGFVIDHREEKNHMHLRGLHGHEYGDMSNGCTNLGGHYNPHAVHHGGPEDHERHPGDFGNLQVEENGTVITSFADDHGSLFADASLLGRGIVIHAGADDHGKGGDAGSVSSGNAGKRIACCAIVACPKPDTVWDD
ncbi:uncharacterized protein [Littorina saxatilis]